MVLINANIDTVEEEGDWWTIKFISLNKNGDYKQIKLIFRTSSCYIGLYTKYSDAFLLIKEYM